MKTMLSCSRTVLLAALATGLMAIAGPLAAQQPAVNPSPPTQAPVPQAAQPGAGPGSQTPGSPAAQAPTPPPSWQLGRPENEAAVKLAPVPALPIATALDKLPNAKLKLPKGFNIEVFAAGLTNARSLRVDDKGNVFVSTRLLGRVYAVADKNGKKEVKTLATEMNSPNGIALHNGTLYIAEINKISKITRSRRSTMSPTTSITRPSRPSSMTICRAMRRMAGNS